MKTKQKNLSEPVVKQRFKKAYQLRQYQDIEAKEEIKDYEYRPDDSAIDRQYGERPERCKRG